MLKNEFEILISEFRTWYSTYAATGTVNNRVRYVTRLDHWCKDHELSVTTVTMQDLSAWLLTVGESPSTRKNAADAAKVFYKWAVATRRISYNPAKDLPAIRVPRGVPRPTPDTVLTKALEKAPRLRDVLMLMLASYGGLRAKEIAPLHTNDVRGDMLRIVGKGGHVRHVPIHPLIQQLLDYFPTGFLFPSTKNFTGHYLPESISQRLNDLLGPGWSGHTLRHYCATRFFAQYRDIHALQELLGHVQLSTTMIYTQVDNSHLQQQVQNLATTPALERSLSRPRSRL